MVEREELQKKLEDVQEEIDYFTQKITKLEAENKSLRLGNNQGKRIKDLEDELEALKTQLQQTSLRTVKESDFKTFAGKEQLTKEEAIKLQREVQ